MLRAAEQPGLAYLRLLARRRLMARCCPCRLWGRRRNVARSAWKRLAPSVPPTPRSRVLGGWPGGASARQAFGEKEWVSLGGNRRGFAYWYFDETRCRCCSNRCEASSPQLPPMHLRSKFHSLAEVPRLITYSRVWIASPNTSQRRFPSARGALGYQGARRVSVGRVLVANLPT